MHRRKRRERTAETRVLLAHRRNRAAGMSFAELRTRNNAGEEVSFEAFAGKVVLAVNVARL